MRSCIYEGQVSHARTQPVGHRFRYRMFMLYLDLAELDSVFADRWLWSADRPAVARFRRADHLGDAGVPLDVAVRDRVEAETGRRPPGPVCLLTHLAYFGFRFNPVSFYYCFADDGETLEAIVAEVNNTPWGEQDVYVLAVEQGHVADQMRFRPAKTMHVSPFMPMQVDYDWVLSPPGVRLGVFMGVSCDGHRFFTAGMQLRRRPLTGTGLARVLVRFPLMTMKVVAAIYWQALRLWVKGVPFHTHPGRRTSAASTGDATGH